MRDSAEWPAFVDLLFPMNQVWAKNASALLIACSNTLMARPDGGSAPSPTHSFDAGAAWAMLSLQALKMGLQTHAMAGLDRERAARDLGIPETVRVEAAIAIGWAGDKATLPEAMQERETPSGRNPVTAFAFESRFSAG